MHHYGYRYRKLRAALLGFPCELMLVCEGDPADSADHTPPLSRHVHVEGGDCCQLRPACMRCQGEQARLLSMATKRHKRLGFAFENEGDSSGEPMQSVEWL